MTRRVLDRALTPLLALFVFWLVGCGKTEAATDTKTNWLSGCVSDDDCSNGLSCLCGVCTLACTKSSECRWLEESAICSSASSCADTESACARTEAQASEGSNSSDDAGRGDAGVSAMQTPELDESSGAGSGGAPGAVPNQDNGGPASQGGSSSAPSTTSAGAGTSSETPLDPPSVTPTACDPDTYDHDDDPSTTCRARTVCEAGQYVADDGSANSDRVCASCAPGTFSSVSNALACTPWTSCSWTELEAEAPSATADRSCAPGSAYRLLPTVATSVAADHQGSVLVGGMDGTVRKYDSNGNESWTEAVQTPGGSEGCSIAVDSQDNALVASRGYDPDATYLSKYDPDGNPVWTYRVEDDLAAPLRPSFVAATSQDDVVIAGTSTLMPFLSKYDRDGNHVWFDPFAAGATAFARSVVVDGEGNLLVAGDTNGKLTGIEEDVPGYLFVRKYDPDGNPVWLEQFGNEGGYEEASAAAVDSNGNSFAAGFTNWNGTQESVDAIVRKYDPDGNELWTQEFGTLFSGTLSSGARALAVDGEDNLLVACNGLVLGESARAGAVVRKYDPDGNELWTQFEAEALGAVHTPVAMTLDNRGRVFVVGSVAGDVSGARGFIWLVPEP